MVKAMASASRGAPKAMATRRSNPKATPAQSGMPAARAARRFSSSGGWAWPRAPRRAKSCSKRARCSPAVHQFVKAVGQFDAVHVELEAGRHRRMPRLQSRQRGLRGRVVADEAGPLATQAGADDEPHQQIELGIAVEFGAALDALAPRGCAQQLLIARAVRVDPRVELLARPSSSAAPPARAGDRAAAGGRSASRPRSSTPHRRNPNGTTRGG